MRNKKRNTKKIFIGILILILSTLIFTHQAEFLGLVQDIKERKDLHPVEIALTLIIFQILTAPLGFPGAPITIVIGTLFGSFVGTIIALFANTLGGCLAFLLSRYLLRNHVQKKFLSHHPKIKRYEKRMMKRGIATVAILRALPLFPFNSLNFLLGTTKISFRKYVLGSFSGMLPGTFLFVYFGDSLRTLSLINIALAILGMAVLTYAGIVFGKKFENA